MGTTDMGFVYPDGGYTSGWRQGIEDLADSAGSVILESGIPHFADAGTRDAVITSPTLGLKVTLDSDGVTYLYDGSDWVPWDSYKVGRLRLGETGGGTWSSGASIGSFDLIDDPDGGWSTNQFTVQVAGTYLVACQYKNSTTTTTAELWVLVGGSIVLRSPSVSALAFGGNRMTGVIPLSVGNTVTLQVSANVVTQSDGASTYNNFFHLTRVGP